MPTIGIHNVSFAYQEGKPILSNITTTIESGSFVSLLGPSGCGKSTLLRLIAGLSFPSSGEITLDGVPISGPGLNRGVVFQDYSLFPWMTAGENVVLALRQIAPGKTTCEYRKEAREYLSLVKLQDAFDKLPKELSGGMRQRVAIARTLALGSPLLLLDEPFGALDPVNRLHMQDLLRELFVLSDPEKTVIFVTHDVEEALYLGERVLVLGSGTGQVIEDFLLPFPLVRKRDDIYASAEFASLRNTIFESYHRDLRATLDAPYTISSPREGI